MMNVRRPSIWWDAFGYFAAYVPYAALTRALADGTLPGSASGINGVTLLPAAVVASVATAIAFLYPAAHNERARQDP